MLTESSPALHGSSCANFAFLSPSTGPKNGGSIELLMVNYMSKRWHWGVLTLSEQRAGNPPWSASTCQSAGTSVASCGARGGTSIAWGTWPLGRLRLATAWHDLRSKISTLWCAPKILWLHLVILAEECRGYHMYTTPAPSRGGYSSQGSARSEHPLQTPDWKNGRKSCVTTHFKGSKKVPSSWTWGSPKAFIRVSVYIQNSTLSLGLTSNDKY